MAAPPLRRRLGLAGTTASGVGIILGAGIYALIGEAAEDAGAALWIPFGLAAVLAASTGLSYAELASMFPEAGASSVYAREAFGRTVGFLVGWLLLVSTSVGAAAVALAFGGYLDDAIGWGRLVFALAVLGASAVVIYVGVRETIALAVVMTLIEAGGLMLIIGLGLVDVGLGGLDLAALLDAPRGLPGLMGAAALVFFAFTGFEQIATLSEETRGAERTIPRAMLLAIAITTVLYMLVAVTSVSVLPWEELAASAAPLARVAERAAGGWAGDLMGIIALFATGNTALMMLATGARLAYGMGRRGLLPPPFMLVSMRRRTPWFAGLAVTAAATALALLGDLGFAARVANFALFVTFILVNGAVVRLRFVRPEARRVFRSPGALWRVPVVPLVGGGAAAVLMLSLEPLSLLAGASLAAAGLALSRIALRHEVVIEGQRGGGPHPPAPSPPTWRGGEGGT